ncbi:MAG: hypothetical protein EOP34_05235 [Rickettsiales bacterium]|nr:MAG: hypothetical protein EOP34_05235 [Rickettsiales bacterium]
MHRDACLNHDVKQMEEIMSLFYSSINKYNVYFRGECFSMMNEISQHYSFNINISPKELAINITTKLDPSFNPKEIENLYFHDSALSSNTNLFKNTHELLDAIVLARNNPNLIIHLTCDQKWFDVEKELGLRNLTLRGNKPQTNPDLVIIDPTDSSYSVRDLKVTSPGVKNLNFNINNTYNLGSISDKIRLMYKNILIDQHITKYVNVLDSPGSSKEEKQYAKEQIEFISAQSESKNSIFDVSIHPKFKQMDGFSIITSDDYNTPCNNVIQDD